MKRLVLLAMLVLAIGIADNIMSGDNCYITFISVSDRIPGDYTCSSAFFASIAAVLGIAIVFASYVISLAGKIGKNKRETKK